MNKIIFSKTRNFERHSSIRNGQEKKSKYNTWMLVAQFNDLRLRKSFETPLAELFGCYRFVEVSVAAIGRCRAIQPIPPSILNAIGDSDDDGGNDRQG